MRRSAVHGSRPACRFRLVRLRRRLPNPPSASRHNADLSSRARSRDPCIAMTVGTDRVRHAETHPTGKSKKPVQPSLQKYSDFPKTQITLYPLLSCPSERGVGHRHERWDGTRWTRGALKTKALYLRTEKSCGPDASTPASSWREAIPAGDGDNKARSPGRVRRKPLKPSRAGMPGVSAYPW